LPKRRFSRELYRGYRDRTKWYEREQRIEVPLNHTPDGYGVLSDAIRHDLRHLLAHGNCRLEISRRLVGFSLGAHGGKLPDKSIDTGQRRLNASKKKLFESYEALCIATSDGASKRKLDAVQSIYNRAEKSYAARGGDLSAWRAATSGEIIGSDDNGPVRVEPPAMKNVWEVIRVSRMEFVWEAATAAISMLDLCRWLATAEGHARTGWFSDHEWRGPAQTMKDLLEALNHEEADRSKLNLEALEAAELAARMARSQEREARLELFKSRLKVAPRSSDRRPLEYGGKCRLPNLQKFVARNGGDCSDISIRAWERFNKEIEEWKTCIGCDEHWPDPDWRRWYVEKTIEIWGETQKR